MNREIIPFTTEEEWLKGRVNDLTSSDSPCLFGCGYQTYEELFQTKMDKIIPNILANERMDWGNALQDSIANEFARKHNWIIEKKKEYIRIQELRLGSSFDWEIITFDNGKPCNGLLEIKNVSLDSYKKWIKGFQIEMTPYIEIQVQHQLLVSGLTWCNVGALIGGCDGKVIYRTPNKKIQDAILLKTAEFWRDIDNENLQRNIL